MKTACYFFDEYNKIKNEKTKFFQLNVFSQYYFSRIERTISDSEKLKHYQQNFTSQISVVILLIA